jgi:hypothetical protein
MQEYNTRVEMTFEPLDAGSTLARIAESGWRETQKGLDSSYNNCQGLDADGLLPQGLPRDRDQPAGVFLLKGPPVARHIVAGCQKP